MSEKENVIREYVGRLTSLIQTESDVKEDIAEVKKEMKDLGLDVAEIYKVAQAVVKDKVDDLVQTATTINNIVQITRS